VFYWSLFQRWLCFVPGQFGFTVFGDVFWGGFKVVVVMCYCGVVVVVKGFPRWLTVGVVLYRI
jgi:hypothetical protein